MTAETAAGRHRKDGIDLSGKVALVTGASRGIGKAIALVLADHGAALAIGSRRIDALEPVRAEIENMSIPCLAHRLDVSSEPSVAEFLQATESKFGRIDILVNNAGMYKTEPVRDHALDTWHEVMETNLTSALLTCRHVVKGMIERNWGRIINISSISGKVAEAFGGAYSASKFGLIALTQALAQEVARYAITVNAVCPGWVDTKLATDQLEDEKYLSLTEQDSLHAKETARLSMPQLRFIEPDEVAGLVAFLCSDSARGINGQAINICGGQSLH